MESGLSKLSLVVGKLQRVAESVTEIWLGCDALPEELSYQTYISSETFLAKTKSVWHIYTLIFLRPTCRPDVIQNRHFVALAEFHLGS